MPSDLEHPKNLVGSWELGVGSSSTKHAWMKISRPYVTRFESLGGLLVWRVSGVSFLVAFMASSSITPLMLEDLYVKFSLDDEEASPSSKSTLVTPRYKVRNLGIDTEGIVPITLQFRYEFRGRNSFKGGGKSCNTPNYTIIVL